MKPVLYIAGPMTGLPDYNFPAFNTLAAKLRAEGYTVLNPAESDGGTTYKPRPFYMRRAIEMLMQADAVVLLPGWLNSKGALLEVEIAQELDLPLMNPNMTEIKT